MVPLWNFTNTLAVLPATAKPGDTVSYVTTVTNVGPNASAGIATFSMSVPFALRFAGLVPPTGWNCNTPAVGTTGTVICTRTGLSPGTAHVFIVQVTIPAGTSRGTVTATGVVQNTLVDINASDDTASAVLSVADPAPGDTDGDTLPDGWETRFGLDPGSATGGNGTNDDPDGDGRTNIQELNDNTHPRGFFTRFFAEGAASPFFTTRFALLNVGTAQANVQLRYLRGTGVPLVRPLTIGVNTRATVLPTDTTGMADAEFATVIESDQSLIADRTMTWDGTGYGSHAESSVAAPATSWFLAEGATHSGFQLFYLLQNANSTPATVQVEYLLPSGAPIIKSYPVPANSRANIWVNTEDPDSPVPMSRPRSPATCRSSSSARCT